MAAIMAAGVLAAGSCSNFEDINLDPDSTTTVNASLIATGLITNMVTSANSNRSVVLQKQLFWPEGKPNTKQ